MPLALRAARRLWQPCASSQLAFLLSRRPSACRQLTSAPTAPISAESLESLPTSRPQPAEEQPEFLDLQSLVRRLSLALPAAPARGAPVSEEVVERVSELLRRARLNPREWRQHAVFRRGRYTRNIVGYSPGQFVALLLCWERGQQSPIHDHSGAHCFIKMLGGKLREERFAWGPTGGAGSEVQDEAILDSRQPSESVGFMHDSMGLHRISNPSSEEAAVSLHIYSPPFSDCLVFPPTGAEPRRAPMVSVNIPNMAERSAPGHATSLRGLCSALAQTPPEQDAFGLLAATELSPMEWAMYASSAHFSEFHCVQNLVHVDDRFSVVLSCWSPGQGVPPHRLGRDRKSWVKVLHGSLQWELFSAALFPWEGGVEKQKVLPEGSASELSDCDVKQQAFRNASDSEVAVSLMVFSPPLTQFAFQTEAGVERQDLPSLLAGSDVNGTSPSHVNGSTATTGLAGLEKVAGRRYLSFQSLAGLLDEEFRRQKPSQEAVSALLKRAVFDREEWRTSLGRAFLRPPGQTAPQRVLLAQRGRYTLLLSFWSQGDRHEELRCPNGGQTWTLMLEGELEEEILGPEGHVRHSYVLKEEGLSFRMDSRDGVRVRRRCDADVPCVSLQLYSPARVVDSTAAP